MLDDGVTVAEETDVEVGMRDGVAIDEDLGDGMREVGDNLSDGRDLLTERIQLGIEGRERRSSPEVRCRSR